jgi:hypothetical protein
MAIEGLFGVGAQRSDNQRPYGEVGDKMAVHHVDMDEIRAGLFDRFHLRSQAGEIRRENGGRDADRSCHGATLLRDSGRAHKPLVFGKDDQDKSAHGVGRG